jgi:hypothetical protein
VAAGFTPSKRRQVQLSDEGVDNTDRVVLADEVIQALGQQRHLLSVLALNKSRHTDSRARYVCELYVSTGPGDRGFSHGLGHQLSFEMRSKTRPWHAGEGQLSGDEPAAASA